MENIINEIEILLSNKIEKDIPCCEDSTHDYDAYNNIDNMYLSNKVKVDNITIFNEYINDFDSLANILDVDNLKLKELFSRKSIPSKGLACAIGIALNIEYNKVLEILEKLGYKFNSSDYDKIINYFLMNNIYDIKLLNDTLIHFGQMYLYSRKKLR